MKWGSLNNQNQPSFEVYEAVCCCFGSTIPVKFKIWSAQLDAHPSVSSLFSLSQSELSLPSSLDLSPEMVVESVTATP
jgi:hypothetical protein